MRRSTLRRLTRTFILVLLLCATICGGGKALSDGGGPPSNRLFNLLRQDAVVLISSNLNSKQRVHLDHTFSMSPEAVVVWHTSNAKGLVVLRFRRGKWWWLAASSTTDPGFGYWSKLASPGESIAECFGEETSSPSAKQLVTAGFTTQAFYELLRHELPVFRPAIAPNQPRALCEDSSLTTDLTDGYDAWFLPPSVFGSVVLKGGAPPASETTTKFEFTLAVDAPGGRAVSRDKTLHIWFPFVLDSHKQYELLLVDGSNKLEPSFARDVNNALEFKLPTRRLDPKLTLSGKVVAVEVNH